MMPERRLYQMTGVLSACLFGASLLHPHYSDSITSVTPSWVIAGGYYSLIFGFSALVAGQIVIALGYIAWLANPLLVALVISLWSGRRPSFWPSTVALCFALCAIALMSKGKMAGFVVNDLLWLGSFAVIWLAALYGRKKSANTQP